jgi:hypothetical protein
MCENVWLVLCLSWNFLSVQHHLKRAVDDNKMAGKVDILSNMEQGGGGDGGQHMEIATKPAGGEATRSTRSGSTFNKRYANGGGPAAMAPPGTKLIEVKTTSTNDLSFPNFKPFFQFVSFQIQLTQMVILVAIILENFQRVSFQQNPAVRIGQIFVFIYVSCSSVSGLSALTKAKMRFCVVDDEEGTDLLGRERQSKIDAEAKNSDAANGGCCCAGVWANWLFPVYVMLQNGALSFFLVFQYTFYETFYPSFEGFLDKEPSALQKCVRVLSAWMEVAVMGLTIVAAVLVTNGQTDLMNILFNFSGIAIVASLDETLASISPSHTFTLSVPDWYPEDNLSFDTASAELVVTVVSGIIAGVNFWCTTVFD